jgi:group I intron endonuclease
MENLTNWCVYMHENRLNGKKYIGITSQKPTRRWQNGGHYSGNAYFYAAIQKHGWDGFRHEILYTDLTQAEAERLEVELIAKYQTQDPAKGYNLAAGGSTNAGWHHTAEARERIGARTRGTSLSADHREKIAAAQRGEKNHAYGKTLSAEHRGKVSAALRGRVVTEETKDHIREAKTLTAGRAVVCTTTGARFRSLAEAARQTGVNRSNIVECCRGQRQTAGGCRWAYAEVVSGA